MSAEQVDRAGTGGRHADAGLAEQRLNSQFNRRGGTPELPLDVMAVRRP